MTCPRVLHNGSWGWWWYDDGADDGNGGSGTHSDADGGNGGSGTHSDADGNTGGVWGVHRVYDKGRGDRGYGGGGGGDDGADDRVGDGGDDGRWRQDSKSVFSWHPTLCTTAYTLAKDVRHRR